MPESIPDTLQAKIEQRLRYYEDLGIRLFYRDRTTGVGSTANSTPDVSEAPSASIPEENSLPS